MPVWKLWFNVAILALVGPVLLMRKSWPSWKIDRSMKKNPRYMAHLQACKLCFNVEPYLYQPCPVGMGLIEDAPLDGK